MTDAVEALIFDLDDTVCTYRRSGREVLAAAFESVGVAPFFTAEDYYDVTDDYVADSESGVENRERCFAALAAEAGRDPELGRQVAAAYAAERDHANVEWVPGARSALDSLASKYRFALVTNGAPEFQRQKLRALGLTDRFETVVYAGWETDPKPDPAPLARALSSLDVDPARAVKIGDSLTLDVEGAHNAGVQSVWLEQNDVVAPEPTPHYRIATMDELAAEPWA